LRPLAAIWLVSGCTLLYGDPQSGPARDLGLLSGDLACNTQFLNTDPIHCGSCDNDCRLLPGVDPDYVECVAGVCEVSAACLDGRAQCPGDNGCDTRVDTAAHCGGCTVSCSGATPFCSRSEMTFDYRCVGSCDGVTPTACGDECANTLSDPRHCGGCDTPCSGFCEMGMCNDCPSGKRRCGGVCVYESVMACGTACSVCSAPTGATARCDQGACDFDCLPGAERVGDDCVVTWQKEELPSFAQLWGIWGSSANDIYVVGEAGALYHSTGDGTWTAQASGTTKKLVAVWGSSASDVWVLAAAEQGAFPEVLHSMGNGAWMYHSQPTTNPYVSSLWGPASNDLYVAAGGVYRNNGAGWSQVMGVFATHLFGFSASNYYGISAFDINHWDGASWKKEAASFGGNLALLDCVFGSSTSDVWAGGTNFVYHSTGIDNWTQEAIALDVNALWGTGPNDMYAGGQSGLQHRDASGWQAESSLSGTYRALWGSSSTNVYAVGNEIVHKIR
jgi:hypothetical protein